MAAIKTELKWQPKVSIHDSSKLSCELCTKVYCTTAALNRHMLSHSGKSYPCDVCHKVMFSTAALKQHTKSSHSAPKYQCGVCKKIYRMKPVLKRHMLISHSNSAERFECDFCDKTFKWEAGRNHHAKVIHGPNNAISKHRYDCEACGNSFTQLRNLKRHLRLHTGERPYKCDVCTLCFKVKYHLVRHVLTHQIFSCEFCDDAFVAKRNLNTHLRLKHDGKTQVAKVQIEMETARAADAAAGADAAVVSEDTSLKCNICNEVFDNKEVLEQHLATHRTKKTCSRNKNIKNRSFHCDVCPATFTDNRCLEDHIVNMHEPAKCKFCCKVFSMKRFLNLHIKQQHRVTTMAQDKKYGCEFCNKEFPSKNTLCQHMQTHRRKPFECDYCGKMLRSDITLKNHVQNLHSASVENSS